jgi:hypothetical protein
VGTDVNIDANAENPDWTYDPNEPRYCICNQVSYGDMVACDNEDVSISFSFGVSLGAVQTQLYEIMNCTQALEDWGESACKLILYLQLYLLWPVPSS